MLRRKSHLSSTVDESWTPGAYEDRTGFPESKKKKRKEETDIEKDEEERRLEDIVFGSKPLASYEPGNGASSSEEEVEDELDKGNNGRRALLESKSLWHDKDDDVIKVDIANKKGLRKLRKTEKETVISGREYTDRLRTQFQKMSRQPLWSQPDLKKKGDSDSEEESDSDEEILRHTGDLLGTPVTRLPGGMIDIKRMRDVNVNKRSEAVIQSLEFHPTTNIMLTAGMHKTLSLFQVDGENNPHIQSVFLKRFPIQTAHFSSSGGEEIVMAADRHWFYVFDMPSGRVTMVNEIRGHAKEQFSKFRVSPDNKTLAFLGNNGYIMLLSNKTKQWIADLKMNGSVSDVAFTPDSKHLLSTGSDGHVYVWDMRSRDCIHRFTDDGCVKGTTLDVSPDGNFIATGSNSGVVNIYNRSCLSVPKPHPLRAVMNLTTGINSMTFSPSSEILAISSRSKKSATRLVHLSSLSVFSNWPVTNLPLNHVSAMDFSSDSRYLSVGNDRGKALLFRLNHYNRGKSRQ